MLESIPTGSAANLPVAAQIVRSRAGSLARTSRVKAVMTSTPRRGPQAPCLSAIHSSAGILVLIPDPSRIGPHASLKGVTTFDLTRFVSLRPGVRLKIGRAAFRERVCHDVENHG